MLSRALARLDNITAVQKEKTKIEMENVEEVVVEGGRWENIKKGCCEACSSCMCGQNNVCWEDYEMQEKGRKRAKVCLASTCHEAVVV